MSVRIALAVSLAVVLGGFFAHAAKSPDEKLYAATRKGNADKVERLLEAGVAPETRIVALSVATSDNEPGSFEALWSHDNSDIASDALDYALCYAYRNKAPAPAITTVLAERSLAIDGCCEANHKQPFCAGRPIRLTPEAFPATRCTTIFTDEAELPSGAVEVALLWDERVEVLDPAGTARYGTPELTTAGARKWALEFAELLGEFGADAMYIRAAGRNEDSSSTLVKFPKVAGDSGFKYGKVVDRIEIVALRTDGAD